MSDITDLIDENPIAGALGHTDHHKKLAKKANALGKLVTDGYLAPGAIVPNTPEGREALAGSPELSATIGGFDARWMPSDHGYKSWAFDPANVAASAAPVKGTLYLTKLKWPRGDTLTSIIARVGLAGSGLTAGQCFTVAYDSAGALLGATVSQDVAWASTGNKTMALTAPAVNVQSDYIYVGFWWNGTTGPQFVRGNNSPVVNAGLATAAGRFATADTGLTTTAPATCAALALSVDAYWVAAA